MAIIQKRQNDSTAKSKPHNIIMENRNSLNISGVKDIDSFDEKQIIIYTELGELVIKGKNLNVDSFDNNTGNFKATGVIVAMIYTENRKNVGFFTKLLR